MGKQADWHEFQMVGHHQLVTVTWTVDRSPIDIDPVVPIIEPSPCDGGESRLLINIHPFVVESNPVITIISGNRTFRVIEETSIGDLDDGTWDIKIRDPKKRY